MPTTKSVAAPAGDAMCIACHSMKMNKALEDGAQLSLHIVSADFTESVHGKFGCASCHSAIAKGPHPTPSVISNKRDYSITANDACKNCHKGMVRSYQKSIHASLVADGNQAAPLCTDCHSSHAIQAKEILATVSGQPCKGCHEAIFDAYAESVHGTARENGNTIRASHIQAPICSDCHSSHDISAVAASEKLKEACIECHPKASLAHQEWLPNSELHLAAIACPACHSPMAERRVDLRLYDNLNKAPLAQAVNNTEFQDRLREIDIAGDGLDPMELWNLVRQTNQDGEDLDITLQGRVEVSTGADAHRIANKGKAVRDCQSCHQSGASTFNNVTVSIAKADGRKQRYKVESEALNSAVSVDSVRNFYAMGGTRIKFLDGMLILALFAGVAVPIGHIALGKILKKLR
jgi:predicted CXXCH cytochrome family protein